MANVLLGIHCVVPQCGNTQRRVNQWKVQPCNKPKHKGKSHAQCMCPEPYQFFKFPHEVKLQKLWLERVKRPDLEVNNLTRVCSLHFVEGKPTRRNYFPNIINLKKNVRLDEDEADNEEEVEEHYYEEEAIQDESPPPSKQRRGVSIVPMEMLQEREGDEDDVMGHADQGEGEYERNVTVSRYKLPGSVGEAYEVPTNSVTITRVSTTVANTASTPANKPSNRFISKTRVVEGSSGSSPGNRFLWDRRNASSNSSVGGAAIRRNAQQVTKPSPRPLTSPAKKTILMRSRLEGRNATATKVENVQERQPEEECPYEIDMLADENDDDDIEDDGGDSSELSDIGIDIQTTAPPPQRKKHFTSKDLATAKTLSSLVVSRHMAGTPTVPQKEGMQINKPRVIPVLAVAPKTQLQQGAILQPIQTIGRTNLLVQQQQNRKSGQGTFVATSSTSCKPIITSTTSLATSSSALSNSGSATKSVIAVTGSVPVKPEIAPSTTTNVATSSSSTAVGQQQTSAATPTLATYDPSRQQLQIANPVKYIQECHTRIAQLLAEKQTLESQNSDLEAKVQELLKSNNDLRREIVHQALNAARRAPPQQLATPTFNLVPTAILDNSSTDPLNNANGNNNSSENGNGVNTKTRIRYVIRRPANMPSGNTKK